MIRGTVYGPSPSIFWVMYGSSLNVSPHLWVDVYLWMSWDPITVLPVAPLPDVWVLFPWGLVPYPPLGGVLLQQLLQGLDTIFCPHIQRYPYTSCLWMESNPLSSLPRNSFPKDLKNRLKTSYSPPTGPFPGRTHVLVPSLKTSTLIPTLAPFSTLTQPATPDSSVRNSGASPERGVRLSASAVVSQDLSPPCTKVNVKSF